MNRKYNERNTRKLVRLGTTSLAITLPIELITNMRWRVGQRVRVLQSGKTLVVKDFRGKKRNK